MCILVALLHTFHTDFSPPCMPWLQLLGLLGGLCVTTGPLKVAKFSQAGFQFMQSSLDRVKISWQCCLCSYSLSSTPLPGVQMARASDQYSEGLGFESQLGWISDFFLREVYVQGTSNSIGVHNYDAMHHSQKMHMQSNSSKKVIDDLKEMANSRLEHKFTNFNNS